MQPQVDPATSPPPPEEDLAAAIVQLIHQGKVLAARCRAEGAHTYVASILLAAMRRLEDAARLQVAARIPDAREPSQAATLIVLARELARMPAGCQLPSGPSGRRPAGPPPATP
jgi:hypothetical protein